MSIFDNPRWRWRWEDMCGSEGLVIWSTDLHDLGLCFQQLFLQIPVLALLAVVSSYYSGRHVGYIVRGKLQTRAIKLRCFIVLMLTLLPIIQTYIAVSKSATPYKLIKIFLAAIQCFTWLVHLIYVLALRRRLGLSPRGPVKICVLWTLYAVLTVISLHSHYLIINKPNSTFNMTLGFKMCVASVVFHVLYALTLIPSEGSTEQMSYSSRYVQIGEQSPLLANNAFMRFQEEQDPYYLGVAMEDSTFLSRLLFYWVNPLVKKGAERKLNHPDDLFDLPVSLSCGTVSLKLDKAMIGNVDNYQRKTQENVLQPLGNFNSVESSPEINFSNIRIHRVSLLKALHKCFWLPFYSIGFLKLASDCAGFAGPLLLNRLVDFIENKSTDIGFGYLYASGLFLASLIGAFCNSHFNFMMSMVGLKIRASLVTAIYRKTLTVGGTVLNSAFNVGEIVNFMSTDTDRIVNSCPSFHALWSIPFQLAITLYLLYQQVGLAFLAGVSFSILLIPINKCIASKIGELSTKMMEQKDERVKMMTEVLRGIRTIKLHVWESHFIRIITKQRTGELRYLKGRKYLDALCVYFWATTPVLISILTFGTYVLMGNKLTAATVFTTMALLNMLIAPLNAFPWVLNGITEAWVSIKRVQRLLDLPDLDLEAYYDNSLLNDKPNVHVLINNARFHWGKSANTKYVIAKSSEQTRASVDKGRRRRRQSDRAEEERQSLEVDINESQIEDFYLSNINLNVKRGEFIGVVGQVGTGKSSLLAGILAEIAKLHGSIAVAELEMGFGFVTQQAWLQRATLRENILFGKAYDDARYRSVLYACCLADDIHLLPSGDLTGVGEGGVTLSGGQKARVALARAVYQDKPIYLLDDVMSAVDRNVARHIYQHCIVKLLANKTRILCTHHTQYVVHADHVIVMENGTILRQGKPSEVLQDFEDYLLPTDLELSDSLNQDSRLSDSLSNYSVVKKEDNESILNEEYRETGSVHLDVYGSYWKSVGHMLSISILLSMFLMQTTRNMTDWWLSYWVSNSPESNATESVNSTDLEFSPYILYLPENGSDYNMMYYMAVYGIFVGANTLLTLFRAFLFAYGGIIAATKIHKTLLKTIMKAKVIFFDISPLGRILNRFSSDTYTIDDSLPFIMNILFAQIFGTIGAVVITIYGLPWLCLVLVPLVPIYHWLQYHYRLTSRELKRLSSVTLSPVYSHFNETLQGLPTIRALRATQRFKRDNEDNVEANQKAQFASYAASQWLGLRLQFIGVAMVTGVGMIAVIKHQFDVVDPGLVGLAISYALSITSLLSGVVNTFTETEREMIAVERVNQYIDEVEPEKNSVILDPPYAWPSQGVVSFNHVIMKYREHLPPSLRGVTFETRPAEKIGVVGRTGAGKSSLFSALFRLVELYSGTIVIDTVNIAHISLDSLRSRLSIIPQDPFLFSGTVRENLDPLQEFRDHELWAALTRVDLAPVIRRLGGLDAMFNIGGSNLSVGQRQLVCLARAVLHNAKILCIDEATANVDQETDRQIQQTLRSAFRKSTVITIAHRVQTILDYDRVLVMGDGQIVEFDSPNNLLADSQSCFYQLVNMDS